MKKIVLLGDSITEGFPVTILMQGYNIINKGISGDYTEGVFQRLDPDVISLMPDILFVMIGTNDLAFGRTDDEIMNSHSKLFGRLKNSLPETEIHIISILPVRDIPDRPNDRILKLNENLKNLSRDLNLKYLDMFSDFADDDGKLRSDFTDDGLHLNGAAYKKWAGILKRIIPL